MENVGANDHEMLIVRMDANRDWTEEQVVEYVKNDPQKRPKWAVPVGALYVANGPPVIGAGESASVQFMDFPSNGQPTVVEDGSLEPGTYLFMCFLGKPPHAAMGMVKKVTVT